MALTPNTLISHSALAAAIAIGAIAAPVLAQEQQGEGDAAAKPAPAERAPMQDDVHSRELDYQGNIVVTAVGLKQLDLLAGTSVFEAEEIQQNMAGQLGDVLVKLPGVSATSFSPGASRPVLRGFQGERVRVLNDGLGTIDVSNTSVDHATTLEPLTAERIEVLRGPAVMLYGSQAIGGAVNVIDKRIPRRIPDEPIHVDGLVGWNSAYDLREGGLSVDIPLANRFVVHVDGTYRETNDLEIAGFTVAPILRDELLEEAAEEEAEGEFEEAEELREAAEQRGILPNSATRTWTANAGFAFIDGDNTLGVAVGWYDTRYGVPGRPGAGHHHGEDEGEEEEGEEEGEERVSIDLEQFRADLRGQLDLGEGAFSQLITRIGYSDYTHTEFEGDEVGTVFDVQGFEARLELAQKDRGWWRGSIGTQYYWRDFFAEGAEAYVPPNVTEQFALFALQEFGNGPIQLEAAARYEMSDVEAQTLGVAREFGTLSGALSLIYETDEALRFGANFSRAERAPSAEELFSDGPHIATQAFEIGDPTLDVESAWGVEAFLRGRIGKAELNVAVYQNWFSDYVYLVDTGLEEDDLPVFQYLQDDAEYFGVEAELSYPLYQGGDLTIIGDVRGDYIRASLDDGSPIPRIPPLSLLGALEAQTDSFDARAEVQWFAEQDRVAGFETPTDSFTLVNLSLSWRPFKDAKSVTVLLGADNLLDVTGRRHASFTKDFVPLAGRNLKASVRVSF
ncbi:TonB-dependent receptor [Altererythrobacter arenosus]|uniref:TonB-dependent receptor n=1 Tax=Altererythrobacter arenosus TaxID=3032592 RepID=A0ABY8FYJ4_9SPHN|nr:TonB-dependent receptor [Altererythrobacter sp. CAU 1644]WFL78351.1 TonB-dependent receptor [Altererythrobacter sp. CAU 1644]